MDQEKIGRFLAQVRKERGMTQEQLGERLGVSQRTVSRWETGRNMPDISMLPVLCAELGISVAELLSGERIEGKSITKADAGLLADRLIGLVREKKRLRRLLGALVSLLLTVSCMLGLYNYEFGISVASTADLEAAVNEYCFDEELEVDVLERVAVGSRLFVLFRDELHPGGSGLCTLERGIFGRYRVTDATLEDYPLCVAYLARIGGREYLLTWCVNELPGVAAVAFYDGYDDGFQASAPNVISTQRIEKTPFLHVEELPEGTTAATFGSAYYDAAGRQIPRRTLEERFGSDGSSSGTGYGTAELGTVYVLEGIILLLGLVFIRYFLQSA